jgi:hypothetical protein
MSIAAIPIDSTVIRLTNFALLLCKRLIVIIHPFS